MVPGWVLKRFLYWRVIRLRVERTGGSEGNGSATERNLPHFEIGGDKRIYQQPIRLAKRSVGNKES